ncbi:nucleic acid-binding protein [Hapalosiphon sp. MRB220]|nr:nucleic acid-binding protein [Hapalosiphon sp. MRB220]
MIIISDTSAITNLAAINHLHLLPKLYNQVKIPEAVYRELTDVESPVPGTVEVQSASWIEVKQVVNHDTVERLRREVRLDPGESEAIALALELDADLLLIDERRGRAEADRLGLRIIGLLGILVEAKRQNLIVAVKPLMDALIATSEFRLSPALYNQILEIVDEA